MGGQLPAHAEVVLGRHDPHAEEGLPPAVGGDAPHEGVLRVHQPAGEVEARHRTPVRGKGLGPQVREGGDRAGLHGLARVEEAAANEHVGGPGHGPLSQHQARRQGTVAPRSPCAGWATASFHGRGTVGPSSSNRPASPGVAVRIRKRPREWLFPKRCSRDRRSSPPRTASASSRWRTWGSPNPGLIAQPVFGSSSSTWAAGVVPAPVGAGVLLEVGAHRGDSNFGPVPFPRGCGARPAPRSGRSCRRSTDRARPPRGPDRRGLRRGSHRRRRPESRRSARTPCRRRSARPRGTRRRARPPARDRCPRAAGRVARSTSPGRRRRRPPGARAPRPRPRSRTRRPAPPPRRSARRRPRGRPSPLRPPCCCRRRRGGSSRPCAPGRTCGRDTGHRTWSCPARRLRSSRPGRVRR